MNIPLIVILSILVLIILLIPVIFIFRKVETNAQLLALLYVFCLIWCARFLVSWLELSDGLTVLENVMDSFVHALQTFSMDEDYTSYTIAGKRWLLMRGFVNGAEVYAIIISIMNVCAPIFGGAVLLEVLAGIFPKVKLLFAPFRRKVVFSGLNEESVALAEDLMRDSNYRKVIPMGRFQRRPMIIFTGGVKAEGENESEILTRAAALRPVSLKTDITGLRLGRSRSVYYFLMDEEEQKNIVLLTQMLREGKGTLWPAGEEGDRLAAEAGPEETDNSTEPRTKFFIFCQSDFGISLINRLTDEGGERLGVQIRPVRDYANAAVNLLYRAPLFLPLLDETGKTTGTLREAAKEGERARKEEGKAPVDGKDAFSKRIVRETMEGIRPLRELHVTILGSGSIAEEVFKTAYWCGQMAGIQLFIHVLSDNAQEMKKRIETSCPELLLTCAPGDDILRIFPGSPQETFAPPYAVCSGFDICTDAQYISDYPKEILEKTVYYIVALGSDEKNVLVSMNLQKYLVQKALDGTGESHPVIAPAIYNDRLADSVRVTDPKAGNPYILPFATLGERFSCRNVFMEDITEQAQIGENLYNQRTHKKRMKDEYNYWSNIARSVHAPYKLFAFGCIRSADLDAPAAGRFKGEPVRIETDSYADDLFAWMEHRRWNAYLRSRGFACASPRQHAAYYSAGKMHKDVSRKLHTCLVECSIRGRAMPEGIDYLHLDIGKAGQAGTGYPFDALDYVSVCDYRMDCLSGKKQEGFSREGLIRSEYKQWDNADNDAAFDALSRTL